MPRVLNRRTNGIPRGAVYVGRPTKFGNPMTIKEVKRLFPTFDDEEAYQAAVDWYAEYLGEYLKLHPEFWDEIRKLHGKDLVCWCKPLPCHADILLRIADIL